MVDREERRQGGTDPDIAAIYSYRDAGSTVLFEVVR
jgi:hypothetical protein